MPIHVSKTVHIPGGIGAIWRYPFKVKYDQANTTLEGREGVQVADRTAIDVSAEAPPARPEEGEEGEGQPDQVEGPSRVAEVAGTAI